ncbi:MAG TPA: GntG family PLP-dependent aldolase [Candidatus Eremiobacteraeota bacterium]|nr:MAG: L-allo-threonine aldolase [bacterium ADurb.Bin363]HPZ08115.1 GntG family PLP-dependent aldolase [Candidatus Eremiobacteraeota bacterium]
MKKRIDFRSDTVTLPTQKMRQAIFEAELGDDVIGEDPTVNKLQALAAELTGKEAALLVTSGTMGNQISIKAHTLPGQEIIVEELSHIFIHELAGAAVISGLQTKALKGMNGIMNPLEIEEKISIEDDHAPGTSLICIENPHNMAGGVVVPLDTMKRYSEIAKKHNLKIHLDGARLFNAALALKKEPKEITQYVDSVMFCLSKSLCAPIGSIICGSKEFISKAHRVRKMLGGGMRQAGIIAAPGIVALEDMTTRLFEDHEKARILAQGIDTIDNLTIDINTVETNMVFFNTKNAVNLVKSLEKRGILCWNTSEDRIRMAVHYYITEEDILYTIQSLKEIMKGKR